MEYYPAWLGPALLTDDLPWAQGLECAMPEFLAQYTLHDSNWITLTLDATYDGLAVAVIRWDTFWTEGRVPFPSSTVAEWPILLIRFRRVRGVRLVGFEADSPTPRTITGAASAPGASVDLHVTRIEDLIAGAVELEHAPEVTVLCLARDRSVLQVPMNRAV